MNSGHLLESSQTIHVRAAIGRLLSTAMRADFAISRLRLLAVDLTERELARARLRVLLGRLDVSSLMDAPAVVNDRKTRILRVRKLLESGRAEVRVAVTDWTPDFSLYDCSEGCITLIGAHFFAPPAPATGPSFTAAFAGDAAFKRAATHFDSLWSAGYDVLPTISDTLERLLEAE